MCGKAPRAECLKYNEQPGCYLIQYKNNSNIIAQPLRKSRQVYKSACAIWPWQRLLWSSLAVWKRGPANEQLSLHSLQDCLGDASWCSSHAESQGITQTPCKALSELRMIVIVGIYISSLENQSRHGSWRSHLLSSLFKNSYSWWILCGRTLQKLFPFL